MNLVTCNKKKIMKKLSLLFTFLIMVSCNNTAVQKVADSMTPDAEIVEVEVNNPAGYLSTADGNRSNAFDGNQAENVRYLGQIYRSSQ